MKFTCTTDRLPSLRAAPGLRCLVFVRAGNDSLHPTWIRSEPDRTWDLFVSYYGAAEDPDPPADFLSRGGLNKFSHFLEMLEEHRHFFSGYDYIWLPDPDLAVAPGDVGRLFAFSEQLQLDLCQPSLSTNSFSTYRMMLHNPDYLFRQTNLVEVMCPLFARDALLRCAASFSSTKSTWGIDLLWPGQLGEASRIGIVDAIQVTHTKPIDVTGGAWYRKLRSMGVDAGEELAAIMEQIGMAELQVRYYPGRSVPAQGRDALSARVRTRLRECAYATRTAYWELLSAARRGARKWNQP